MLSSPGEGSSLKERRWNSMEGGCIGAHCNHIQLFRFVPFGGSSSRCGLSKKVLDARTAQQMGNLLHSGLHPGQDGKYILVAECKPFLFV